MNSDNSAILSFQCDCTVVDSILHAGYNMPAKEEARDAVNAAQTLLNAYACIQDLRVRDINVFSATLLVLPQLIKLYQSQVALCEKLSAAISAMVELEIFRLENPVVDPRDESTVALLVHNVIDAIAGLSEQFTEIKTVAAETFVAIIPLWNAQHAQSDTLRLHVIQCGEKELSIFEDFLSQFGTNVSVNIGAEGEYFMEVKLNKGVDLLDFFKSFVELCPRACPFLDGLLKSSA